MYKPVWTINKTTKQSLILKQKYGCIKLCQQTRRKTYANCNFNDRDLHPSIVLPFSCHMWSATDPLKYIWLYLWNITINWCVLEIEKHFKIFLNVHSISCITNTFILQIFFFGLYSIIVKNYLLMKKSTRHSESNR